MYFIKKLVESIKEKKSVVCMGLDPRMGQLPTYIKNETNDPDDAILEFNKGLIEGCFEFIPVIKPQIAFYEKYDALNALKETIKFAHRNDLLVILDSKRNDIGSTSEAYASATFDLYKADACTLNAYLGIDGIRPYLNYRDKGLFILVKTSNPSSKDFQDLFSIKLSDISEDQIEVEVSSVKVERNYFKMARLVNEWGDELETYTEFNNLGVVIGATFPTILKQLRVELKKAYILLPGYGAQGATAQDIKYGFKDQGLGAIVSSSRGIIYAYHKQNVPDDKYVIAAKEEILKMNKEINKEIGL